MVSGPKGHLVAVRNSIQSFIRYNKDPFYKHFLLQMICKFWKTSSLLCAVSLELRILVVFVFSFTRSQLSVRNTVSYLRPQCLFLGVLEWKRRPGLFAAVRGPDSSKTQWHPAHC